MIGPLADARADVTKFGELTGTRLAALDRMRLHMERKIGVNFSALSHEALTAFATELILAIHETRVRMAPIGPVAYPASQLAEATLYPSTGLG